MEQMPPPPDNRIAALSSSLLDSIINQTKTCSSDVTWYRQMVPPELLPHELAWLGTHIMKASLAGYEHGYPEGVITNARHVIFRTYQGIGRLAAVSGDIVTVSSVHHCMREEGGLLGRYESWILRRFVRKINSAG